MKRNNGVVLVHDETIWQSKNLCDIMGIQIFVNFRKFGFTKIYIAMIFNRFTKIYIV